MRCVHLARNLGGESEIDGSRFAKSVLFKAALKIKILIVTIPLLGNITMNDLEI